MVVTVAIDRQKAAQEGAKAGRRLQKKERVSNERRQGNEANLNELKWQ